MMGSSWNEAGSEYDRTEHLSDRGLKELQRMCELENIPLVVDPGMELSGQREAVRIFEEIRREAEHG